LREAVAAWNASLGKSGTARIKALIKRLKTFWSDHPQEKVLVFTSHSLAVAQLAESLGRAFGEDAVETFGAHQDTLAREEAARRFRDSDQCPILVCDPLGGEGRNFQFVSVVAHHDLPWSVAAVEQRIGRVDRLGRDGDVPSWIVVPEGEHVDSEWARLLDGAFDVFNSSSSGLEFVAEPIEIDGLDSFLRGGAPALHEAAARAGAAVKKERNVRDQREDELFHEESATYAEAARVAQSVAQSPAPIDAILRWTRGMGGSVKREEEAPRATKLRTRYHDKPDRGVFDRDTALANPDVSFFALGNGTIDRLIDDAAKATWCSAMGWRRKPTTQVPQWDGLRIAYETIYDLAPIVAAGLPVEVLRRLFLAAAPKRSIAFVRLKDGQIETDPHVLLVVKPLFDARAGDTTLSLQQSRDLWTRPLLSGALDKLLEWQNSVARARQSAERHGRDVQERERNATGALLERELSSSVAVQHGIAAVAAVRFGAEHAETKALEHEAELEQRQADALRAAVAGATVAIASVAYIAVA
jgi:hypothetical protein